jgi:hypothetical protein
MSCSKSLVHALRFVRLEQGGTACTEASFEGFASVVLACPEFSPDRTIGPRALV